MNVARCLIPVHLFAALWSWPARADVNEVNDGSYGRLDGDLSLSIETGASVAFRAQEPAGGSLAVRGGLLYLHTVGVMAQYNDALGIDAAPMARSIVGTVELRPLFLGRFAEDQQQGPAHLDLLADSFALGLGIYGSWQSDDYCQASPCRDLGMELSMGAEVSILPQANSPFFGLRGAVRWTFQESGGGYDPDPFPPQFMLTLSFGYHHVLLVHLVDPSDRAD